MILPELARSYLWSPSGKMGPGLDGHERPGGSEEEWARVDALYREVSARLQFAVYLLLTDRPAENTAESLYVYLEPFAHLVLAIDRENGDVSISSDWWMWKVIEPELSRLTKRVRSLAGAGRTVDALVESLLGLGEMLAGEWHLVWTHAGLVDGVAVTHTSAEGTRRWNVTRS